MCPYSSPHTERVELHLFTDHFKENNHIKCTACKFKTGHTLLMKKHLKVKVVCLYAKNAKAAVELCFVISEIFWKKDPKRPKIKSWTQIVREKANLAILRSF